MAKEQIENKNSIQKNNKIIIPLFLQFILSIITLIVLVVYFFYKDAIIVLQISLGLTMLVTGYNNYYVYKRKFFTLIYFIIGLLLLVLSIITMIGI